ncbi:tail fiber protein [Burkholderia phage BcepB1A]|uniref:tail fiber protein n=1 Tax=Burkholderia phage BcepB1A TaxID=279530 RepID=UPI00003779BC|nr:tail fiber protein [Burkholderia phage BcepB1A]AAT37769.1 gp05 H [Burkholderia phage BcepB1A]
MSDQKFFDVPFAFSGDQSAVPDATQPDGSVSFMEGWGFDYQRDLATDPLAKPVDRSAMNYLLSVITAAIGALQKTGIPEWVTAAQNGGVALPYPKYAQVRYSATTPATTFETYVSVVDNNTSVPGSDANWQPIASIVASVSDVIAGTSQRLPVTPLTLKSYPGNAAQTFNVGAPTSANNAIPVSANSIPRSTALQGQVLAPNSTYTAPAINFTAPCKGYVVAMGHFNLGAPTGSGTAIINCTLTINGNTVAGDSTQDSQSHSGVWPVAAGAAVAVAFSATTTTLAGSTTATLRQTAFFIPTA